MSNSFPNRSVFGVNNVGFGPQSSAFVAALVLALPALFYVYCGFVMPLQQRFSYDLAINYSAATLLRTRPTSIYDRQALRQVHKERVASVIPITGMYQDLFTTYITPPTSAFLVLPFTFLPFSMARAAFLFINHLLYLYSIFFIARILRAEWKTKVGLAIWSCALTYYPFVFASSWLGQLDAIILFLLTVALACTLRRKDAWAGACIALASFIKISPILLIGFFLIQRRWSVLRGLCIVTLLWLVTIEVTVGHDTLWRFVTVILPSVGRGSAFLENQSLLGAIYHFAADPAALISQDAVHGLGATRLIWVGLSVALVVFTLVLVKQSTLEQPSRVAIAFGAFILVSILVSSISWDHYLTWALIPIAGLIADWFQTRWLEARVFWPAFGLVLIGMSISYPMGAVLLPYLGRGITSCGTYGALALLALIAIRLRAVETITRM